MPHNGPPFLRPEPPEASASWRWTAWLRAQVATPKTPLLINMDETNVRFFYQPAKGLLLKAAEPFAAASGHVGRNTSLSQQRRAFTHVAFICDDEHLQARLPQVLVIASHNLRVQDLAEVNTKLDGRAILWRRKSGWVDIPAMCMLMRLLAKILSESAPTRQPILLMDAHRVHCSPTVLKCCRSLGIWVSIIPASTTHFLQPLDTDVFAQYKRCVRRRLQQCLCYGPNADLAAPTVLMCVAEAIQEVLHQRSWSHSFTKNGYGSEPFARHRLLALLEWDQVPNMISSPPTLEELQACFPAGMYIPVQSLLQLVHGPLTQMSAGSVTQAKTHAPAAELVLGNQPWSKRTRSASQHELHLQAISQPSASSECIKPVVPPQQACQVVTSQTSMQKRPMTRSFYKEQQSSQS